MEEGVDGVRELLLRDSRCGGRGIVPVTLRIERLEGVRVEGKEEREVWRLRRVAVLPVAPLVEGRYERTDVIFGQSTGRRIFKIVHTRREEKRREEKRIEAGLKGRVFTQALLGSFHQQKVSRWGGV